MRFMFHDKTQELQITTPLSEIGEALVFFEGIQYCLEDEDDCSLGKSIIDGLHSSFDRGDNNTVKIASTKIEFSIFLMEVLLLSQEDKGLDYTMALNTLNVMYSKVETIH